VKTVWQTRVEAWLPRRLGAKPHLTVAFVERGSSASATLTLEQARELRADLDAEIRKVEQWDLARAKKREDRLAGPRRLRGDVSVLAEDGLTLVAAALPDGPLSGT
jgi:hypothetical protein